MITIHRPDGTLRDIKEKVNDYRELLQDNQFIIFQKKDAIRACRVLGTKNATMELVAWKKPDNVTLYKDWVITVN